MMQVRCHRLAACALSMLVSAPISLIAADEKPKTVADAQPAQADPKPDATATPPASDTVGDQDIVIVVGGQPTPGRAVLPATETDFKFKLAENGVIVSLRWNDLQEVERKRVQKLYGIVVQNDHKIVGEKVKGVKITLESGKALEGFPMPERDRIGQKAIKTTSSVQLVPEREIKSLEQIECDVSEFFSAKEIYDRWMLERPPGPNDAGAHYAMAQKAANIGLYDKALDQLQMATVIDPRLEERYKDFRMMLISESAKQQAWDLYTKMLQAKSTGDYFTAWYLMEQLDRNFPNSEYKSRWDALRAELETNTKAEQTKRIVQMCYPVALDVLQQQFLKKVKIDDKGNVVASIPGKMVTTRQGRLFKGKLVDNTADGDIVIQSGDIALTIAAKDIMTVQDVDLSSSSKEIGVSFDEMKDFVNDASRPDGLKVKMIAKISQILKVPEDKVKEVFESRCKREAKFADGELKMSPNYSTLHDASWGRGSWLREGSQPAPVIQIDRPAQQNRRINNYNNNNGQNQNQANKPPDPKEDPDLTDDPEIWWKYQDQSTQFDVLKAMMAEKIFEVDPKNVLRLQCSRCNGKKLVPVYNLAGNMVDQRCPACRGMGIMFKVIYH